jgi:2-polyprenyl-3-methyl-5-hydroxy-6-metoxy-1,4-benzoquinol methylase
MNWKAFWNDSPQVRQADFCRQVGRTFRKAPYTDKELDTLVARILTILQASPDKTLLDLACGNGLVTSRLASHFQNVTAVDFSRVLIETAKAHFQRDNIDYVLGDARQLAVDGKFDCILISAAIQHFTHAEAALLLERLKASLRNGGRLMIGDVPDRDRIWSFYRGVRGRLRYAFDLIRRKPVIGSWWRPSTLGELSAANGWTFSMIPQTTECPNHYFRYDALLQPVDSSVSSPPSADSSSKRSRRGQGSPE